LRDLVLGGGLNEDDEICAAGGYWIYLYERDEVRKLLGIEVPFKARQLTEDEVTQTDTELDRKRPEAGKREQSHCCGAKKLVFRQPGDGIAEDIPGRPLGAGMERPTMLKIFAFALVALAVFSVLAVLKMLNS